jgi:hypothetical protein
MKFRKEPLQRERKNEAYRKISYTPLDRNRARRRGSPLERKPAADYSIVIRVIG